MYNRSRVEIWTRGILRDFPDSRNYYQVFMIKFIDIYCNGDYNNLKYFNLRSIERTYRRLQNDCNVFPPEPEIKKHRQRYKNKYTKKKKIC